MIELAKSKNYRLLGDYEHAMLRFNDGSRGDRYIGDFYGDVQCALFSKDEKLCIMGGCGIIIYFLKEPFSEYSYHSENGSQWKEYGRNKNRIIWVEDLHLIDNGNVLIVVDKAGEEQAHDMILNLDDLQLRLVDSLGI